MAQSCRRKRQGEKSKGKAVQRRKTSGGRGSNGNGGAEPRDHRPESKLLQPVFRLHFA